MASPKFEALKPDLYKQLLEKETRYQEFGVEIARISFAGIALLGFYVQYVRGKCVFNADALISHLLGISVFFFAASIACALAHRFYSTQGFSNRVRYVQLRLAKEKWPEAFKRADELGDAFNWAKGNFKKSSNSFKFSIISCGLGAIVVMAAIVLATWFDHSFKENGCSREDRTAMDVSAFAGLASSGANISLDASKVDSGVLKAAVDEWAKTAAGNVTIRNAGRLNLTERAYLSTKLGSRVLFEF